MQKKKGASPSVGTPIVLSPSGQRQRRRRKEDARSQEGKTPDGGGKRGNAPSSHKKKKKTIFNGEASTRPTGPARGEKSSPQRKRKEERKGKGGKGLSPLSKGEKSSALQQLIWVVLNTLPSPGKEKVREKEGSKQFTGKKKKKFERRRTSIRVVHQKDLKGSLFGPSSGGRNLPKGLS